MCNLSSYLSSYSTICRVTIKAPCYDDKSPIFFFFFCINLFLKITLLFILISVFFLSGLTTKKIGEKVYVGKGARDAYMKSSSGGKAMYTVLFCGSADGTYLPTMTVYKGSNNWAEWKIGGPEGTCYGVSPKGWMLEINFEKWFTTVFVKFVKNYLKPVLLMYYGHNSHLTFKTCKAAVDSNIILVCLPPNTSHAMQPFDVAVFKSVKTK